MVESYIKELYIEVWKRSRARKRILNIPRTSNRGKSTTIWRQFQDIRAIALGNGAVERVIQLCTTKRWLSREEVQGMN